MAFFSFYQKNKALKELKKKLTVYDLIIFLLALAFLAFLAVYFRQKPTWVKVGVKYASTQWWVNNRIPQYWQADALKIGSREIGLFNQPMAIVRDIETFDTGSERKEVYLAVDLQCNYLRQKDQYVYQGQLVEIGGPIELHLSRVYVQGQVISITGVDEKEEELLVTGMLLDRYPWQFEVLEVGDEMTDSAGRFLGRIEDKHVEAADYLTTDWQGRVHLEKNPLKQKGIFKVRIKVTKRKGIYYFRRVQVVKVAREIDLHFDQGDLNGFQIIKIEK
ncbi:MAG: hypothetical protein JW991_00085 [Candidatus Pacebacteria bacterium]|nr:hypothetical protein [Candidatus Paceibacterota bacterium]